LASNAQADELDLDDGSSVAESARIRSQYLPRRAGGHGNRHVRWQHPSHEFYWQNGIEQQPPLAGPGSSPTAWELSRSSVVYFDLLLIQKLLKTEVKLEQQLRCPTCNSAGSSGAALVLDGPAKLRRVCGPDHTYYIQQQQIPPQEMPRSDLACAA
jgi:hypothetical protein